MTKDQFWEQTVSLHASAINQEACDRQKLFARVFGTDDGRRVLRCLRRMTIDVPVNWGEPDARLRHMEGQRALVRDIFFLVEAGMGVDRGTLVEDLASAGLR